MCLENVQPDCFLGCKKAWLLRNKLPMLRHIKDAHITNNLFRMQKVLMEDNPGLKGLSVPENEDSLIRDALITFTSGSTGTPKTAVRTQKFLLDQFQAITASMPYRDDHVDLAVLPVFTIANLGAGITTYLSEKGIGNRRLSNHEVNCLLHSRVNRITASPSVVKEFARQVKQEKLPIEMKAIFLGGGPIYPHVLKEIEDAFPKAEIRLIYGSTEVEPIAEISANDLTEAIFKKMAQGDGLYAGSVVDWISCRIVSMDLENNVSSLTEEKFDQLTLEKSVGEIVVSGATVLPGYLNGIGDEESKIHVDDTVWHRTGDLGYFDESGDLWLMGRKNAVICDERGILYPFAVETAVLGTLGLEHVAVIQKNGERILVLETSKERSESFDKMKSHFSVDRVVSVDNIPMDVRHHAKIDYKILEKMV